ncbi:hypothetical protein EIP91_006965 [Steccherinum ochraceum]|uniref:Uncharacterized protein n=1 Tax=Steccherinum ochraceum TaxID=92696 RepID=A0A4R0R7I1_9APHY|nr:hypothetical protein EIP91_006965 [Steccherinum ochraceum]
MNASSRDEIPVAVWAVVDLVSRELQAKKEELQAKDRELAETESKLDALKAVEIENKLLLEENKLLREEVKNLRNEVDEMAVKRVKIEAEGHTSNMSSTEQQIAEPIFQSEQRLPHDNTRSSSRTIKHDMITLQNDGKTAVIRGTLSSAPRKSKPTSRLTGSPTVFTTVVESVSPHPRGPTHTGLSKPTSATLSDMSSGVGPSRAAKSMSSTLPLRRTVSAQELPSKAPTVNIFTHPHLDSVWSMSTVKKPAHLAVLSTNASEAKDPVLLMRTSLRIEWWAPHSTLARHCRLIIVSLCSDAYPALSCSGNIVWCMGNTSYDALLINPTTTYDPNAAPAQSWQEKLSLGAPRGQTCEIIYYETPDTMFYAGTYECSGTEAPVSLTYSQLSDTVCL